jgi:hypothetical protein
MIFKIKSSHVLFCLCMQNERTRCLGKAHKQIRQLTERSAINFKDNARISFFSFLIFFFNILQYTSQKDFQLEIAQSRHFKNYFR